MRTIAPVKNAPPTARASPPPGPVLPWKTEEGASTMAAEPIELTTKPQALGGAAHSGGCACGHADEEEIVLDTRTIPHAIRHATIFGALGAIAPGFSLDLVANHNPLPLLSQLEERTPGMFDVAYIDDGPDVWRLRFTREQ